MPGAAGLVPPDGDLQTANVVAAEIKRAPVDEADTLSVVIPSFDPLKVEEVRFWMPRGTDIPSEGDEALIAYSEDSEPWLVAWVPS